MTHDYSSSDIIRINTLDGPVYHMKIPLIFRFDTIADAFEDDPHATDLDIKISKQGFIDLLRFFDINGEVDYSKNQWRQVLEVADYLNVNRTYLDMLLDAFLYDVTKTRMKESMKIRDVINQVYS